MVLLLLLGHFSRVRLCATPYTAAHQAPPSLGFSRQEHWSALPFLSPMHESDKWKWSRSVVSDSSQPRGLQPTRLLHPWDVPGKSTGVGCHCLLRVSGSWGCKESHKTEWLNWTDVVNIFINLLHLELLQNNGYVSMGATISPCCLHSCLYFLTWYSCPAAPPFSFSVDNH